MISKDTYSMDHIKSLCATYKKDPALMERVLFAFGLLEAITIVKMPFIFKGGSSLMLIFNHPQRLSTDIDILVEPGTNVDFYLNEASKIFPFKAFEEDIRFGMNKIEKRHFKFIYESPMRNEEFYILLDIVFEENPYSSTETREIKNDLLLSISSNLSVTVPVPECILGDKLTAFAPHTTGVPFGIDKELEIIKQLFDVAILSEKISNYQHLIVTYDRVLMNEIGYRGIETTREEVLLDTICSCICIIGNGIYEKNDYPLFIKGIHAITGHVLSIRYNAIVATEQACKVMYLASCLLTRKPFYSISDPEQYIQASISKSKYNKLSYMRKQNLQAFAYIVESLKLIE